MRLKIQKGSSLLIGVFLRRMQWITGGFLKRRGWILKPRKQKSRLDDSIGISRCKHKSRLDDSIGISNQWNLKRCNLKRKIDDSVGISNQWNLKRCKLKRKHDDSVGISVLPIECIAHILSFTSPRDVCVFSLLSHIFKSAAEFDQVWEKFLPLGYKDIISKSSSLDIKSFASKKDIFVRLRTAPILIDGGHKSLTIDTNGTINLMIGSRELVVHWDESVEWKKSPGMAQSVAYNGDIIDHCRWRHVSNSRFPYAIELITDSWHKIIGKIDVKLLSPNTNYSVHMIYKFAEYSEGSDIAEGDNYNACLYGRADSIVNFVRGEGSASGHSFLYLCHESELWVENFAGCENPLFENNAEAWLEFELGQFFNDKGDAGELEMILLESAPTFECRLWMQGLIVYGIEIRGEEKRTSLIPQSTVTSLGAQYFSNDSDTEEIFLDY